MKLPKVPMAARRIATITAVGAVMGYAASKGHLIDPALPSHVAQQMAGNLPDPGAAMGTGAAVAGAASAGYEAGKHQVLGRQWD